MGLDPNAFRAPALAMPRQHDGTPALAESRFLAPADPLLGTVLSAATNQTALGFAPMTKQQKRQRVAAAFLILLLGGALGAIGLAAAVEEAPPLDLPVALFAVLGFVLGGVLPTGLVLVLAQRRPRCEYVGTEGVERYVLGWFGRKHTRLLFAHAQALRVSRVRQYYNGVYVGTMFTFTWTDGQGKKVFHLGGQYNDNLGIESGSDIAFAQAAEDAWTGFELQRVERSLATQGLAWFRVGSRDAIGVGPGVLFLRVGGAEETLPVAQLESVYVRQGMLTVRQRGAKDGFLGIGSQGVRSFNTAAIDNLNVLAAVLARHVGIQVQ